MIENDCGKGTGTRRLPKVGLEAKGTAGDLNDLGSDLRLSNRCSRNQPRAQEEKKWLHWVRQPQVAVL